MWVVNEESIGVPVFLGLFLFSLFVCMFAFNAIHIIYNAYICVVMNAAAFCLLQIRFLNMHKYSIHGGFWVLCVTKKTSDFPAMLEHPRVDRRSHTRRPLLE